MTAIIQECYDDGTVHVVSSLSETFRWGSRASRTTFSYEQAHEENNRVRQERIEHARAYSEEAAEFVRRTIAGNPVPGAGPYPYQGANSWRDAGRLSPPDSDSGDPWDDCWTIVAWTGRDWSAVSIPERLVRELRLTA